IIRDYWTAGRENEKIPPQPHGPMVVQKIAEPDAPSGTDGVVPLAEILVGNVHAGFRQKAEMVEKRVAFFRWFRRGVRGRNGQASGGGDFTGAGVLGKKVRSHDQ